MVDIDRASKAFEDFTGSKPKWVEKHKLDERDRAGYRMGKVVGVAYEATRDGERAQYFHRFAPKSRPELVASSDGRQLYISRGSYEVTDRGIEDRMPTLFVVNPSERKGKKSTMRVRRRRRKATAARPRTTVVRVRSNPIRRRRRASGRRSLVSYKHNPIRRRRRHSGRMSLRKFRRNPMGIGAHLGGLNFGAMLIPGVLVGAGAVGAEALTATLTIPASWKVGITRHFVKAGIGIAAGMAIASVLRMRKAGEYVALGSIVIATHDAIKDALAAN